MGKEYMGSYKDIIEIAKSYLVKIKDYEHNIHHTEDVVEFCEMLFAKLPKDISYDKDCVLVSAWWHDVGRLKKDVGHEQLSAELLKNVLIKNGHSVQFAEKCYKAIEFHKWNMTPTTIEGLILKDADKLGWIGLRRWSQCLQNGQQLNAIVNLLPKLRNEILHFNESREIYDSQIVKLVNLIYDMKIK